jgi:hypothetical protein
MWCVSVCFLSGGVLYTDCNVLNCANARGVKKHTTPKSSVIWPFALNCIHFVFCAFMHILAPRGYIMYISTVVRVVLR